MFERFCMNQQVHVIMHSGDIPSALKDLYLYFRTVFESNSHGTHFSDVLAFENLIFSDNLIKSTIK